MRLTSAIRQLMRALSYPGFAIWNKLQVAGTNIPHGSLHSSETLTLPQKGNLLVEELTAIHESWSTFTEGSLAGHLGTRNACNIMRLVC
jgi:hypothetical protein